MGKKFAQQQKETQTEFFNAGVEMGRQQIIDMMCLVLNNPKVMKKDTFGRDRLNTVIQAILKEIDKWSDAWQKKDESDALQAGLDAALAQILGVEELEYPFHKRYEYSHEFDYKNNRWR